MKNPKTTLTAIVTVVAMLIAKFGIQVTPDVQVAIVTVGVFILGIFAQDSPVTPDDIELPK